MDEQVQVPTEEVVENEAINETEQEQPEQETEAVESQQTETQDVPAEPTEVEEEDDIASYNFQQPEVQAPTLDFNNIPTNEDGTLDANALAEAFNNALQQSTQTATQQAYQLVQQVEEARAEEKLWNKALEAHPELKKDKALAEEVQALRFGLFAQQINEGKDAKMLTPSQAYKRVSARFSQAKAEGVKQATESVRVQESVYVEPTQNAGKSESSDETQLFNQMRSPDRNRAEAASMELLKKRLFGK